MNRSFIQIGIISATITIASFDYFAPGYMKFYSPVDSLNWKMDQINPFSRICKRSEAVNISEYEKLNDLLKNTTDFATLSQILGKSDCESETDEGMIYAWDLKDVFFVKQDISLRITVDAKTGLILKWELLR